MGLYQCSFLKGGVTTHNILHPTSSFKNKLEMSFPHLYDSVSLGMKTQDSTRGKGFVYFSPVGYSNNPLTLTLNVWDPFPLPVITNLKSQAGSLSL